MMQNTKKLYPLSALVQLFTVVCVFTFGTGSAVADTKAKVRLLPPNQLPYNAADSFHRRAVNSSDKPWVSVGKLTIEGARCTGTLIDKDIVLTAAHCLYSPHRKGMVPPDVIHFLAGFEKDNYAANVTVKDYVFGSGFNGNAGPVSANLPFDWALLVLKEPIGDTLGYLELHSSLQIQPKDKEYEDGIRSRISLPTHAVTTAGYPKGRTHVLSLEEGCGIKRALSRGFVVLTDCIAIQGDSGGPILQKENDKWVIIGTQTAATQMGNQHVGVGVTALAFRYELAALLNREKAATQNPDAHDASNKALNAD